MSDDPSRGGCCRSGAGGGRRAPAPAVAGPATRVSSSRSARRRRRGPGGHGHRAAARGGETVPGLGLARHGPKARRRAAAPCPLTFILARHAAPRPACHCLVACARATGRPAVGGVVLERPLRLNQLQALGTHNSYHVAPHRSRRSRIGHWQYTPRSARRAVRVRGHPPDRARRVRATRRASACCTSRRRLRHDVPDATSQCLQVVKTWSDAHPQARADRDPHRAERHRLRARHAGAPVGRARAWTSSTPRSARSSRRGRDHARRRARHATRRSPRPIATDGWPTIDSVRGKVHVHDGQRGRRTATRYTAGHPTLEGRMIFTNSQIRAARRRVHQAQRPDRRPRRRSRPRSPPATSCGPGPTATRARPGPTTPAARDAALASGAQWVSTDYEVPGRAYGSPYFVAIPGGTPRALQPDQRAAWCTSGQIESLAVGTAAGPATRVWYPRRSSGV